MHRKGYSYICVIHSVTVYKSDKITVTMVMAQRNTITTWT